MCAQLPSSHSVTTKDTPLYEDVLNKAVPTELKLCKLVKNFPYGMMIFSN